MTSSNTNLQVYLKILEFETPVQPQTDTQIKAWVCKYSSYFQDVHVCVCVCVCVCVWERVCERRERRGIWRGQK